MNSAWLVVGRQTRVIITDNYLMGHWSRSALKSCRVLFLLLLIQKSHSVALLSKCPLTSYADVISRGRSTCRMRLKRTKSEVTPEVYRRISILKWTCKSRRIELSASTSRTSNNNNKKARGMNVCSIIRLFVLSNHMRRLTSWYEFSTAFTVHVSSNAAEIDLPLLLEFALGIDDAIRILVYFDFQSVLVVHDDIGSGIGIDVLVHQVFVSLSPHSGPFVCTAFPSFDEDVYESVCQRERRVRIEMISRINGLCAERFVTELPDGHWISIFEHRPRTWSSIYWPWSAGSRISKHKRWLERSVRHHSVSAY